ncbi:outer membrane lipid asymmetry maintenance protein MlaD [Psittacicella gerlachiana]|uniref:Outer membrane lipid asymmetry maintenance protein MlaD n=1 Tax=Psittacicella gerlachiana TaxID=2028574 RepID=A0A3A1Y9P7_9GAMM|nr:outer membrane lipid asymmetry maintenance protein MlaD [Psittacicella gerlachiana]RIY33918.1 outer membrane lipid asymmetry maintenance protein MlaD [Psittacicella gerlachiana]
MRVSARIQFYVGLFILFVIGCFIYMSLNIGFKFFSNAKDYYTVTATFTNINGLKDNAAVKIGGLQIGYVERIALDPTTYEPKVYIKLEKQYNEIPDNSTLSVKTNGILGDKYLDLRVGFDMPGTTKMLTNGSIITNTVSAVDLEDLISKFAFGDK